MNLDWYHLFLGAVFILWAFSTPADQNALRIVLIASLFSEVMVDFVTHQISAPWKLVVPCTVELLTIAALWRWAKTRTGTLEIGALGCAWVDHVLCYMDVWLGTDIIYTRYEAFIQAVALAQLLACHDTIRHMVGAVGGAIDRWRGSRAVRVRPASYSASALHLPGNTGN